MYLLWRTIRFWTIIGCLIYTVANLTPQILSIGDWLGHHLQKDSQRQTHAASLAKLRAENLFGGQQTQAPKELLLSNSDQPVSIQEYYKDAH